MATLDPHPVSRAGGVRGLLLLLAFIGAVIGSVHWGLDRLEIINKPSAEMVLLRQVRGSLPFRPPDHHSEDDRGCYRDGKGAAHCARHILLSYDDASASGWSSVKQELEARGWKHYLPDTGTNRDVYLAWNGDRERPVCIARAASDNFAGGREDAIFLETATDSGCQRTIDKLTGQPR